MKDVHRNLKESIDVARSAVDNRMFAMSGERKEHRFLYDVRRHLREAATSLNQAINAAEDDEMDRIFQRVAQGTSNAEDAELLRIAIYGGQS